MSVILTDYLSYYRRDVRVHGRAEHQRSPLYHSTNPLPTLYRLASYLVGSLLELVTPFLSQDLPLCTPPYTLIIP